MVASMPSAYSTMIRRQDDDRVIVDACILHSLNNLTNLAVHAIDTIEILRRVMTVVMTCMVYLIDMYEEQVWLLLLNILGCFIWRISLHIGALDMFHVIAIETIHIILNRTPLMLHSNLSIGIGLTNYMENSGEQSVLSSCHGWNSWPIRVVNDTIHAG